MPHQQLPLARIFYTLAGFAALIIIAFALVAHPGLPGTSPNTTDWHTTHTFSGTTQENTAPITINSSQWQILWSCQPTTNGVDGALGIILHNPNTSDPLDVPVNATCPAGKTTAGSTYDYQTGTFYLEITSANVNWTIQIQEH